VKIDMEDSRPMDRLICGDVGYGKTEVAMRAAFKAVYGGKQVAMLAPTKILSTQHYKNFKKRNLWLKNWRNPLKIKDLWCIILCINICLPRMVIYER
jgi:transcription-repair coupling factor (superfamily II helicase)